MRKPFKIDFFELMFLAESVIPPRPIARSMCFDDFSEVHYHKMNENQRKQFFKFVKDQNGFDLNNEECAHFYARFNPKNQYLISCFYYGKAQDVVCYRHEEKYKISKSTSINKEFIRKIVRIYDNKIFKKDKTWN